MQTIDLTGQRFGRLAVLNRDGSDTYGRAMWQCQCDCGAVKSIRGKHLRSGAIRSCGCLRNEKVAERIKIAPPGITHGMSRTSEYRAWRDMKARCHRTDHRQYQDYGGRGITVCPEWLNSFEAFYNHIGPKPERGYSVDRIDNNRGYEPGNVRWASKLEQSLNTRRNIYLTHEDETHTASQWADITGLPAAIIWRRVRLGWDKDKVLTEPPYSRSTAKTVSKAA